MKLVLPLKSVTKVFKIGKARLAMMLLHESTDPNIHGVQPVLKTERKWKASRTIESTGQSLQLKEMMRFMQSNKQGLDHSGVQWWAVRERKHIAILETRESKYKKT